MAYNSFSQRTVFRLCEKFPNMEEGQHNNCILETQLHAEIRIVSDLDNPLIASDHRYREQQSTGCSKQSCLYCALWIET